MTRSNQVYTRHTLSATALDSIAADLERNTLHGHVLGGLRQADRLLRSLLKDERPGAVLAVLSRADVSALVVMQALQYVDADARAGDILRVLYDDIIDQRADDLDAQAARINQIAADLSGTTINTNGAA